LYLSKRKAGKKRKDGGKGNDKENGLETRVGTHLAMDVSKAF